VRIAIDATSVPPRPAGAAVYAIELTRAMTCCTAQDGYALFARGSWGHALVEGRKNWRIESVGAGSRPARLAWEQLRLPGALADLGIDVLHSTHHTLPLQPMHTKRVVTIHDLTFFRIPTRYPPIRRYYFQLITRFSARAADAIIAPSNAVRDDVVRALGVAPDRVTTVYEAAAERFQPMPAETAKAVAARYGLAPGYLLSVGSLEPGKNRPRIIRALAELRDRGTDATLAIVGQPAWKYEHEQSLVADLGMRERVRYLGYVSDDDVVALYSGAAAVVVPSLYEGFGLPVIEAMACGAPVITSNISATAEVAGGAAILVDPRSTASIRDAIDRMLGDPDLRAKLREAGLARAAEFSWQRAAQETHSIYRRVVDGAA
jgi:glycosyltransferase involved in cell wall biosynthesis